VKKKFPLGYWNTNGVATAIVAVATYFSGQLFDWAACIVLLDEIKAIEKRLTDLTNETECGII